MDHFEFTKIAGAVLAALLLIFGTKTYVEMNTGHGHGEKVGYALPGTEAPAAEASADAPATEGDPAAKTAAAGDTATEAAPAADGAAAPAGGGDIVALLASANAENGKAGFTKCKSCHVAEKGKGSTVGPNLWGVVNRKSASLEGFNYSEGLKTKGGDWTFENLSAFLRNPKGYAPGTKMVFAGIKDPAAEADLLAYLATLADTPVALPK